MKITNRFLQSFALINLEQLLAYHLSAIIRQWVSSSFPFLVSSSTSLSHTFCSPISDCFSPGEPFIGQCCMGARAVPAVGLWKLWAICSWHDGLTGLSWFVLCGELRLCQGTPGWGTPWQCPSCSLVFCLSVMVKKRHWFKKCRKKTFKTVLFI